MNGINRYHQHTQPQSRLQKLGLLSALLLALSGCVSDEPQPERAISYLVDGNNTSGNVAVANYTKAIEMTLAPNASYGLSLFELASAYYKRGEVKRIRLGDFGGAIDDYSEAIRYWKKQFDASSGKDREESATWLNYAHQDRAKCKRILNDHQGAKSDEHLAETFHDEDTRLWNARQENEALEAKEKADEQRRKEALENSPERRRELEQRRLEENNERARKAAGPSVWDRNAASTAKALKDAQSHDSARRDAGYRSDNNCSGANCNNR